MGNVYHYQIITESATDASRGLCLQQYAQQEQIGFEHREYVQQRTISFLIATEDVQQNTSLMIIMDDEAGANVRPEYLKDVQKDQICDYHGEYARQGRRFHKCKFSVVMKEWD